MEPVTLAAMLLFAAGALVGAISDLRTRRIPNILNGALAIGGLIFSGIDGGLAGAALAAAHCGVALAIGLLLYALRMWGGGDAKFYAACAAWFSLWEFPRLVVSISLAGLVLLIAWLAINRLRKAGDPAKEKNDLPYGVAIAAGAMAAMALSV